MLVCCAPSCTYPPKTSPTPKKMIAFLRIFFFFFFFDFSRILLTNPFLKSLKGLFYLKKGYTKTVIICILTVYTAFVDL